MSENEIKRFIKCFLILLALTIVGIIYYAIIVITGFSIPCFFRTMTGLKCIGCGLTTMFCNLLNLNFKAAFEANQFAFIMLPFIIIFSVYLIFCYIKGKDALASNNIKIVIIFILFLAMLFFILRNFWPIL